MIPVNVMRTKLCELGKMAGSRSGFLPLCPGCGKKMNLARVIPASHELCALHTYCCNECGVWLTEVGEAHAGSIPVRTKRDGTSNCLPATETNRNKKDGPKPPFKEG